MMKSMKKPATMLLLAFALMLMLAVPAFASTNVSYEIRNATDTGTSYANAYKVGDAVINGSTTEIVLSGASYIQYLEIYDPATNTWSYATAASAGSNVQFTFDVVDHSVNTIARIHVIVPPSDDFPGYNTVHTVQLKWDI